MEHSAKRKLLMTLPIYVYQDHITRDMSSLSGPGVLVIFHLLAQ